MTAAVSPFPAERVYRAVINHSGVWHLIDDFADRGEAIAAAEAALTPDTPTAVFNNAGRRIHFGGHAEPSERPIAVTRLAGLARSGERYHRVPPGRQKRK